MANIVQSVDPPAAVRFLARCTDEYLDAYSLMRAAKRAKFGYELQYCVPEGYRNVSLRDKRTNPTPQAAARNALLRLSWVLEQEEGRFICEVRGSEGQRPHVVGVWAEEKAIFDHEDEKTLPLSEAGFDGCCGGSSKCEGLGNVFKLVRWIGEEDSRKRSRES
jgi:hypothetical protein